MSDGIACMWMRGGTSKGGFFLAEDLPAAPTERDALILRLMGSPDPRQIDGMGGADPVTSKAAVVRRSVREGVDVDYLFLQVFVDRPIVTDAQNCGNILSAVAPFAIERGLVQADDGVTDVRIFMENTGQIATASVQTPGGKVSYDGAAKVDGVPGHHAPVTIVFEEAAGSTCGALLPTGNAVDTVEGVEVTMIDNGMPCVIIRAADVGATGTETPEQLEANEALKARVEAIRLKAGPLMRLGDVCEKAIPKMTLVSAALDGGAVSTRTFIPHRCHKAIGVLGAVSVATACLLPDGPAAELARQGRISAGDGSSGEGGDTRTLSIEHPTGEFTVLATLDGDGNVTRAGVLRTARKLFDGRIF